MIRLIEQARTSNKPLMLKNEGSKVDSRISIKILPEIFEKPKSKRFMQKFVDANMLTADWQPLNLTLAERGYLAKVIGDHLKITYKWKVMGLLWNENSETLRQANYRAVEQIKTGIFIDRVKKY